MEELVPMSWDDVNASLGHFPYRFEITLSQIHDAAVEQFRSDTSRKRSLSEDESAIVRFLFQQPDHPINELGVRLVARRLYETLYEPGDATIAYPEFFSELELVLASYDPIGVLDRSVQTGDLAELFFGNRHTNDELQRLEIDQRRILVPVADANYHWYMAEVQFGPPMIVIHDSKVRPFSYYDRVYKCLLVFFQSVVSAKQIVLPTGPEAWTLSIADCFQHRDSSGILMCANMIARVKDQQPFTFASERNFSTEEQLHQVGRILVSMLLGYDIAIHPRRG